MRTRKARIHIAILGAALTLGSITFASAREIPMSDALAKFAEIQGKPINIRGCSIVHAARDFLACGTNGDTPVSVIIDSATLNNADLQAALKNCGSASPSAPCEADVTGVADRIGSHIVLSHADIFWKSAAEQRTSLDATVRPADAHVLINNCMIAGANREFLSCSANGQTSGKQVLIDAENLPSADMQRAHKHCSGWQSSRLCAADVAGKVTMIGSYYKLEHPGVFWKEMEVALD